MWQYQRRASAPVNGGRVDTGSPSRTRPALSKRPHRCFGSVQGAINVFVSVGERDEHLVAGRRPYFSIDQPQLEASSKDMIRLPSVRMGVYGLTREPNIHHRAFVDHEGRDAELLADAPHAVR